MKPKSLINIGGLEFTFNLAVFAVTMVIGGTVWVTKTTMDLETIKKQLARIETKLGLSPLDEGGAKNEAYASKK